MENKGNVILFPKWKSTLEEESLYALKQKRYGEALKKLNKLLSYQVDNHEIIIGKLICLIELGHHDEAQLMCEDILGHPDENYFEYVHIYLTLLFQTSQYQLLMDQIEHDFATGNIPNPFKEQFEQLYEMSRKMNDQLINKKTSDYMNELKDAINEEDHTKQWNLIENLRKMKSKPIDNFIISLLVDVQIHPVTKTAIFQWLQDNKYENQVEIHKLNLQLSISPIGITELYLHNIVKQILLLISDIEQKNPSMHSMLEKLLYRYTYVRYPIMPPSDDVSIIAEALTIIGDQYLNLKSRVETPSENVSKYVSEIKMCETLYLSIIDV